MVEFSKVWVESLSCKAFTVGFMQGTPLVCALWCLHNANLQCVTPPPESQVSELSATEATVVGDSGEGAL